MYKALKRIPSRIICALIVIALALGVFAAVSGFAISARADENETATFSQTAMHPTNNQFADTDSGSAPQSPTGWTGSGVNGLGGGRTISGVMDLATYGANKESYKLGNDFKAESPFGTQSDSTTNRKVLLINILDDGAGSGSAYGYTSSSVTFAKNRFYMVKAWVRTCNFAGGSGAAIRLNGLDEDVAFTNINTVAGLDSLNKDNKFGWKEYTFYVASSSYEDKTVTVGLQVGDNYENEFRPAKGFALFDNVTVFEIAPSNFLEAKEHSVENDSAKVFDFSSAEKASEQKYQSDNADDLAFKDETLGNWNGVSADTDYSSLRYGVYDSNNLFIEENDYHLTSDPLSAYGKYYDHEHDGEEHKGDSKVLVISSYDSALKRFRSVARGVSYANPVNIERYRYYRISAWIKSQEVSGGSGATFALSAKRTDDELREGGNLFATITSCSGDSSNLARGGFSEYAFYVKGSALKDYDAYIECWLGTASSKSSGIAIFDNITVEEITPADFNSHSSDGTIVNLDTDSGADGSAFVTFPDTGVTNGSFYEIDAYEEFKYPFAPASWTFVSADNASTDGFSAERVDSEDAIHGIIPSDVETFNEYSKYFGAGVINANRDENNVLMLYSSAPTAYAYRSSTITVAASTPGEISVSLFADNMKTDDYGASLVLKDSNKVIASIEKIKNTDGFKTYTFYVEPASSDVSLTLEIWLGNIDRMHNKSRLSAGHVYVNKVSLSSMSDDTDSSGNVTMTAAAKFAEAKTACDAQKVSDRAITKAAYSYNGVDMFAYDAYDASLIKTPYNFSLGTSGSNASEVYFGLFDPAMAYANGGKLVPADFQSSARSVLVLRNPLEAYSSVTYDSDFALDADTYYKLDVTMKVNIPAQFRKNAIGASILITGSADASFKDIKDTSETVDSITDYEKFRTFTFYIKPNSEASNLSLSVSLGGTAYDEQCSGAVYIESITLNTLTEAAYEEASDSLTQYGQLVDLSVETEDSDDDSAADDDNAGGTLDWWLIPSILFAVAILIAIVGFIIRKLVEKHANKKGVVRKAASYDRAATLNREHNKNADEADKVSDVIADDGDEQYGMFDEEAPAPEAPKAETETPAEETSAEESPDEEAPSPEAAEATDEAADEEKPAPKANTEFIDRFDD